ncbi:hypothetical protein [Actinophytocola xanthii]|uniref:hypothetical protein n=1 Tax=Actinophytocola xanthii TaxID=1912961 RepID=UPI0011779CC9|nr:hypothetical protein [Actinophytocola xanthii]
MARPTSTAASALSAFLAVLLKHHLDNHDHSPVFPDTDGGFLWRSSWRTRTFNYTFDGNQHLPDPRVRTRPIRPAITFHEGRTATKSGSSPPAHASA